MARRPKSAKPAPLSGPAASQLSSGRSHSIWPVGALIAFFLFVFSSTSGDVGVWGDDCLILTGAGIWDTDYLRSIFHRGYLTPFYILIYRLSGSDPTTLHRIYLGVFLASALGLFWLLRKHLGVVTALASAMFYLSYPVRHEIVFWLSAGSYLLVTLALLASFYVLTHPGWNAGKKAVLLVVIHWPLAHLNELLLAAAPLAPLLETLRRRLRRQKVITKEWAVSFVPLAVYLFHGAMVVLATRIHAPGRSLVWKRDPGFPSDFAGILRRAVAFLWAGWDAAFGSGYAHLMLTAGEVFREFVPVTGYMLLAGACAIFCLRMAVAGSLPEVQRGSSGRGGDPVASQLAWLGAAYLTLAPHVLGFTTAGQVIPGRLLTLNAIGLSLLAGLCAGAAFRRRWLRWPAMTAILGLMGMQAIAFNTIGYESETAWQYDRSIIEAVVHSGVRVEPEDTIFVSQPQTRRITALWRHVPPQFVNGSASLLFASYYGRNVGMRSEVFLRGFRYVGDMRPLWVDAPGWEDRIAAESGRGRVLAFYLPGAGHQLHALTKIRYPMLDYSGELERRFLIEERSAGLLRLPEIEVEGTTVRFSPGVAGRGWRFDLPVWEESLYLWLEAGASGSEPVTLVMKQGDRQVDVLPLGRGETKNWAVPLKNLTPGVSIIVDVCAGNPGTKIELKRAGLCRDPQRVPFAAR